MSSIRILNAGEERGNGIVADKEVTLPRCFERAIGCFQIRNPIYRFVFPARGGIKFCNGLQELRDPAYLEA